MVSSVVADHTPFKPWWPSMEESRGQVVAAILEGGAVTKGERFPPLIKQSFSNSMGQRGQLNIFSRLGSLPHLGPFNN